MKSGRIILAGTIGAAVGLVLLLGGYRLLRQPSNPPSPTAGNETTPPGNTAEDGLNNSRPVHPPRRLPRLPDAESLLPDDSPRLTSDEMEGPPQTPDEQDEISEATESRPENPADLTFEQLLGTADRRLADGQLERAVELYEAATERRPENLDALRGLVMACQAVRDYERCEELYARIIELDPDDRHSHYNLATAMMRNQNLHEAEVQLRKLIRRWPDFQDARANLATLYQARGKLSDSRRQWERLLDEDPENANAHANLAEVMMDLENYDDAMAHYAEAAKLEPKFAGHWLNLAVASLRAGQAGRGMVALDRAIELAPLDAEVWAMRGDVLLEMYRASQDDALLRQAVESWEESIRLEPNQPQLRDHLKTYRRIVDSDANDPQAESDEPPAPEDHEADAAADGTPPPADTDLGPPLEPTN